MSYTRLLYVAFFLPLVVFFYHVMPKKIRKYVLLLASFIFYYKWSKKLILIYLLSTLIIYLACYLLKIVEEKGQNKLQKQNLKNIIVFFNILVLIIILFRLKYFNLFLKLFNSVFGLNIVMQKLILPLGISYYSLQLISLLVDVKTKKVKSPSLIDILLYTSFFPTVVLGPITRFNEVIEQIKAANGASFDDLKIGFMRIFWGLLKKSAIADAIAPLVALIFKSYTNIGSISLLGVFLCTIQIYMDFSGSIDIAIGSAKMLGITLPENFRQPFFAKDASEFWRRWHITLGHFFRDYIFYPISLCKIVQKISKIAKRIWGKEVARLIGPIIALFFVWLANGLWHGPQITYILYGFYYFFFILFNLLWSKKIQHCYQKIRILNNSILIKVLRFIKILIIVCFGEALFLSPNFSTFVLMVKNIFLNFQLMQCISFIQSANITPLAWLIICLLFFIVCLVNIAQEKGLNWSYKFLQINGYSQSIIIYGLIVAYILFATYGPGFDNIAMMYAGF